ncbi:hypothetical protein Hanom_Chr15g01378221 [Helianthus anomalus]
MQEEWLFSYALKVAYQSGLILCHEPLDLYRAKRMSVHFLFLKISSYFTFNVDFSFKPTSPLPFLKSST